MVIFFYLLGFSIIILINLIITNLTTRIVNPANNYKLAAISCLTSFIILMLFLLIINKGNVNFNITVGCFIVELLFYIINYCCLKLYRNNLKKLFIFFVIIMSISIIFSVIIPLINATKKKCPVGYSYYEDNKCIKLYKTRSHVSSIYNSIDGTIISVNDCENKEYGYSDDGNCYKVKIIDISK